MRTSARVATLLIFFFFFFFNGIQVYLILQRIEGAKAKFNTASTDALVSTLFQYNRLNGDNTAPTPKNAFVVYSSDKVSVIRKDANKAELISPSTLYTDTITTLPVDAILNRPRTSSMDLDALGKLYEKALDSLNVHSKFLLDTFAIPRTANPRRDLARQVNNTWEMKRKKDYPYATSPQRMFFYPGSLIFAELKTDYRYFINDLLWPMLAFLFILLISNMALLFVYQTIRKQKKINEIKTDFINNITHEMKTPITIASAGLQALEHHISPTDRTSFYLHTSKRQLQVLNDFVERILDAAVQDVPDLILKKEKIDLHALFDELIQSHDVLQGRQVKFNLVGEAPVFIQGDRLHLETTFHNIIDNAIKYSNGSVEIHIDIVENNRECTIKIRDNGMGIPPQFIKNIFEKFFRVPQGDAQSIKGFGLGLYYVHSVIKKHSGNITVQSKMESGTEFIITLPKTHDTDLTDRRPA